MLRNGLISAAGGVGNLSITNLAQTDTAQSASKQTTYTFSAVDIGTSDPNRIVVVCIAALLPNNVRFSSATIASGATSIDANALNDGASVEAISTIVSRNVSSGTTADVGVTFTSTATFCGIIVYSFVSPNGAANVVDTYAESGSSTGLQNVSDTITTVDGGAVIGCRVNNNTSTSWTGLSEDVEIDLRTDEWFSGASASTTSTSLAWTSNATATIWAMPIVAYGPA